MIQVQFIEGSPKANKPMADSALCRVKVWNWKKKNYVPLAQMKRLEDATVRETSAEEARRRFLLLKTRYA